MFLFYPTSEEDLARLQADGGIPPADAPLRLWTTLEAAHAAGAECILVVDGAMLPETPTPGAARVRAEAVPGAAIVNLDPYLPPAPVEAGGGYVVRRGAEGPAVLLIFRRGVWDLPKGKCDAGEGLEACALREVREELGIERLRLVQPLGTTVHGYPERGRYRIKTTHWYLMTTEATRFVPEVREGIEAVSWVPWAEAVRRIGYETLRGHMQRIESLVARRV